ncbi:hypothetical protein T229_09650 [Tannerella sp. oral taxon BU063 isolate Cell 5]|uniref:Uncharacterized protein n=1 Tax=Tannerella sp. oral taxon BU063 isolate Cell 5 TaxID=1410950 RepID=W2CB04_9BACT|nr:hypothetical protein T229_09650 [Tannerella sp. oral taxon BU063 isolate Cell 5]
MWGRALCLPGSFFDRFFFSLGGFFSCLDLALRGPSFLALMQEKKQKKIKAPAEAGEVGRVPD